MLIFWKQFFFFLFQKKIQSHGSGFPVSDIGIHLDFNNIDNINITKDQIEAFIWIGHTLYCWFLSVMVIMGQGKKITVGEEG